MAKPRYGIVMDVTKCNGCFNCFLACKDEFCGNDFPPYSLSQPMTGHFWMKVIEKERGQYPKVKVAYTAIPCMHCEDATCIKAASEGEIYRRPDGIVIIDPVKSKGHKYLVQSCPYRVIYWNEEKNIPQKCTLCAHLIDAGWKEPRCVEACPTQALVFGNLNDPNSEVAKLITSGKTEVLHPEYDMQEKVSYIGLPKRFIAGTVVFGNSDLCAENVTVSLSGEGHREIVDTDNFGDFEFEGLEADQDYSLEIRHKGYITKHLDVRTKNDIYLGEIILEVNSHHSVSSKV